MSEPPRLNTISVLDVTNLGVEYHDSTYFTSQQHAALPSPAEVRALGRVKRGRAYIASFDKLGLFVKYGPEVQLAEALSMREIRKIIGSSVPMPETFAWHRDQKEVFIYMQLMRGPNLEDRWDVLDEAGKVAITTHLREIISSLRSVQQGNQSLLIGSLTGGFLHTPEFEFKPKPTGPVRSVAQFSSWFTGLIWRGDPRGYDPFAAGVPDKGAITLTHGDLHPRNIIVSTTSPPKVLALVDWEFAGWYPDYWEYCKTYRLTMLDDWMKRIPNFIDSPGEALDYVLQYLDWIW